jgi:RNA polymerase sigma-70 factor (ECF subfamily)
MNVEPTTFESVVRTFYQPLYRFALTLAKCESTACDLTQETFCRFATKGHQLRDGAKVKTWLFTTLYREFLRTAATQGRSQSLETVGSGESAMSSSPSCENTVDGQTAREALMQIDEVFRAPLVLFYLQEHSYQEIAEILNIPAGTVMSRIARGRALLRRLLGAPEQRPGQSLLSLSL